MANCVDPDENAHNRPSHLDLHCLQRYLFWSAGMKQLKIKSNYLTIQYTCTMYSIA